MYEAKQGEEDVGRRWRPALMSFFLRRVRNYEEAEDLTQEVFVRMLKGQAMGSVPDAYVFQIAQNLLVDRSRRAKVRGNYQQGLAQGGEDLVEGLDPQRIAIGRAELARLVAALEQLPERTRTIFTLYRIEQISQDAIAEAFGISTSAVKKQVASAIAFLMKRMREIQ